MRLQSLKSILILVACYGLFASCKKDAYLPTDADQYLIFGHYYGECFGEACVETFKLTHTALYEDTNDPYAGNGPFNFEKLPDSQYVSAKHMFKQIPNELLEQPDSTFGCPDCADGGGLYIEYKKNNFIGKWRIDQYEGHVPAFLHPFIQEVNRTIRDINK